MKEKGITKIISPINQLTLFGYENYFYYFTDLYTKNKLPNSVLLSGPKGIGKCTFVYHFIKLLIGYYKKYLNRYIYFTKIIIY